MKLSYYVIPIAISLFACNEKPVEKTVKEDSVQVTETLKTLIRQENNDFYKKDIKVWSKYMAQTPNVYWVCVEDDVTLRAEGWADVEQFVGEWMKANPIPEPDSLQQKDIFDDFHSVVSNDLAFIRYHKKHITAEGVEKKTLEHRTFQRIDGTWKVLGMTSAPAHDTKGSTHNVFVHTTTAGK